MKADDVNCAVTVRHILWMNYARIFKSGAHIKGFKRNNTELTWFRWSASACFVIAAKWDQMLGVWTCSEEFPSLNIPGCKSFSQVNVSSEWGTEVVTHVSRTISSNSFLTQQESEASLFPAAWLMSELRPILTVSSQQLIWELESPRISRKVSVIMRYATPSISIFCQTIVALPPVKQK
jgi:hypothetical protein